MGSFGEGLADSFSSFVGNALQSFGQAQERKQRTRADAAVVLQTDALRKADERTHEAHERTREATLETATEPPVILQRRSEANISQMTGTVAELLALDWPTPQVTAPTNLIVRARVKSDHGEYKNAWPVWVVPVSKPADDLKNVRISSTLSADLAKELFPSCGQFDASAGGDSIIVAARFDDSLVNWLEKGGRVLMLPDGQRLSFPTAGHWFLRGAPYIPESALSRIVPRQFLLELQHFDLASPVVSQLAHLEAFDPMLMLWDTHDAATVKTHGLIFETAVGKGRVLVSAIRHTGKENAAGQWLLSVLLNHLFLEDE